MNIYQKILEARKEIGYLQKDGKVSFGNTSYKAITDEKVMTTVRPVMDKYGLVMTIEQIQMSRGGNITEGVITWRITNAEQPDEYILIQSAGQGADTQDKGAGKMMTYSRKYALLNTLLIPTGEDPDKISSEELDAQQDEEEKSYNRQIVIGLGETMGRDESKTKAFAEALVSKAVGHPVKWEEISLEQMKAVKLEMIKRQKQSEIAEDQRDVRQAG